MTIEINPNEQYIFDKSIHHGGALLTYISHDAVNVIMAVLKRHEKELNRDLEKFELTFEQLAHPDWPRLVSAQEVLDAATAVLNKDAPHAVVNIFTDVDPSKTAKDIAQQVGRKLGQALGPAGWCAPSDQLYNPFAEEVGEGRADKPFESTVRGTVYPFAILKPGVYVLDGWDALTGPQRTLEFEEQVRELRQVSEVENLDYAVTSTLASIRGGQVVPDPVGDRRVMIVRLLDPKTGKPVPL